MIIYIAFLIVSFLIEGIISNYFNYTLINPSIFSTIYTLITLIILSKYFENDNKYYLIVIIFGLLYDIVYTNTFIFNGVLFFTVCFLARYFINLLNDNLLNINIVCLVGIFIYHILSFLVLQLIGYNTYSYKLLLVILSHSIIMTIIFTTIIYKLIICLSNKFEFKIIR